MDRSYRRALDALEIKTDFIRDERFIETNPQNRSEQNDDDGDDDDNNVKCKMYTPYNGQYDNLFFFFTHMYQFIHYQYDHNKLLAYRRPIN